MSTTRSPKGDGIHVLIFRHADWDFDRDKIGLVPKMMVYPGTEQGLLEAKQAMKQIVEEQFATYGRKSEFPFLTGPDDGDEPIKIYYAEYGWGCYMREVCSSTSPDMRRWLLTPDNNSH